MVQSNGGDGGNGGSEKKRKGKEVCIVVEKLVEYVHRSISVG